jgi:Ca2+/Na+ antiporter
MEISKVTTNISNLLQNTLQVMHQHSFHHHYPFLLTSVVILLLICLQHSRNVWETQNKPDSVGKKYLEQVSTALSGSQSTK